MNISKGFKIEIFLHFSLVFVPALGFADAVLPPPVQDLLELLLLPAEGWDTYKPNSNKKRKSFKSLLCEQRIHTNRLLLVNKT